jgi:hypothetical protein
LHDLRERPDWDATYSPDPPTKSIHFKFFNFPNLKRVSKVPKGEESTSVGSIFCNICGPKPATAFSRVTLMCEQPEKTNNVDLPPDPTPGKSWSPIAFQNCTFEIFSNGGDVRVCV